MSDHPQATWHTAVSTALGELTLVRDEEALVGVFFRRHWHPPGPAALGPRRDEGFADVAAELDAYLAGRLRRFTVAHRASGSPLQQRVWELVDEVPYGYTTTYGAISARLDGVDAQQVGAAIGRNPLCIVVPCHRVIGANGTLTGYAGGLARKRHLLDLEPANRPASEDGDGADLTGPFAAAFTW